MGHSFVDLMPYQVGTSAQRIRIGLTGLAAAFVIVLIASAINRSSQDSSANSAKASTNEASEPLAELGVTPGGESSNTANNSSSKR